MTNRYIPLREADDPIPGLLARRLPEAVNRRLPERLNRDEVRTPMQWTAAPGVGFCPDDVAPWLPVNDNRSERNVAGQSGDPSSLLSLYRTLLALRAASPALSGGSLRLVDSDADEVLAYERSDGEERLLVVANLGARGAEHTITGGADIVVATDPSITVRVAGGGRSTVRLAPNSAVVLRPA